MLPQEKPVLLLKSREGAAEERGVLFCLRREEEGGGGGGRKGSGRQECLEYHLAEEGGLSTVEVIGA